MTEPDPDLSKQASTVYRQADFMAKTANAGAPHLLVAAQANILLRCTKELLLMLQEVPEGDVRTVKVDVVLSEGFQKMHSELFGDHVEGTLPDTIPDDWDN